MKNLIILTLLLMPFCVKAQNTENHRKGDEAMERKDYRAAILWYEEGVVADCDSYSINQLTAIWKEVDSTMHVSMRVAMGRCLNCLNGKAINNKDTLAIKKLIDYYSEGIGTVKNEASASYWKEQLEQHRNPITVLPVSKEPKERMKFFAGYHASMIAPFGIQVGGIGKTIGWYARFGSNLSFQNPQTNNYTCEVIDTGKKETDYLKILQLGDETLYRPTGESKKSVIMGSAGLMYKVASNISVSAGVGYWDRKYYREFIERADGGTDMPGSSGWARDTKSSESGVTIDLDGTYILSGRFYGTLGVSFLSFKYVYPGIGVGIIF